MSAILISILACHLAATPESGLALEERVLAERNRLTHGRMKFHYELDGSPSWTMDVAVWFDYRDRKRNRWDYRQYSGRVVDKKVGELALADPAAGHNRNLIRDNGTQIFWIPDKYLNAKQTSATVHEKEFATEFPEEFDPLVVGLTDGSFPQAWAANSKELLGHTDRIESALSEETIDGVPLLCSEYVREKGQKIKLWVSPTEGYSLVRAVVRHDYKGEEIKRVMTIQVTPNQDRSLWFPNSVIVERTHGPRLLNVERVTVTDIHLNEDFDDVVFTLKGLDMPVGLPVFETPSEGGHGTWDGEKVVAVPMPGPAAIPTVELTPRESPIRWPLVVAANLAFVALILLVAWWKRSRARV